MTVRVERTGTAPDMPTPTALVGRHVWIDEPWWSVNTDIVKLLRWSLDPLGRPNGGGDDPGVPLVLGVPTFRTGERDVFVLGEEKTGELSAIEAIQGGPFGPAGIRRPVIKDTEACPHQFCQRTRAER